MNIKNPLSLVAALALVSLLLPGCGQPAVEEHHEAQAIIATSPQLKPVTLNQDFVCRLHSQRHIEIKALERGYLKSVEIKEGQQVKAGDVLFKIIPILYQSKANAQQADADYAQLEYQYTKELSEKKIVSPNDLQLRKVKLAEAQAKAQLAAAELNFATIKAPFEGIIDRLHKQKGSLAEKGDELTTLSDNSVMWAYFNVPEKIYLNDLVKADQRKDLQVHLRLADGSIFKQAGKITTIEADVNNETGNILFRADFPNPERLLRNGQTGTVLVSRVLENALIIPQRATFELFDKLDVFVVDDRDVVHKREIVVQNELPDLFVIKQGLSANDKIILEGARQVHDGDKVKYKYLPPQQVDAHLKYHAE